MRRLLAFALLALAAIAPAQEIKFGLGAGGSGGISTITGGTTPTSGCIAGGVLRSISNLVECGAGLGYSAGILSIGTASTTRGGIDLFGATHAFKQRLQISESQGADVTLTLPTTDGDASQFLQTNGSGVLTWATGTAGLIESKGFIFDAPSGARDMVIWRAPFACTASAVRVFTTGGTSANVNARKNGTDALLAGDLTGNAGTMTSNTTLQNASFAAGDYLEARLISLSGSPTSVLVQVECTR